jgi:hypothetical protein
VKWYGFHRGFVEKIEIDAAEFLAHADELYRLAPIRRLNLKHVAPVLDELFRSPSLSRIVSLTFDYEHIVDRGVELLAQSRHLANLSWLDLDGNDITRAGLAAMMKSDRLPSLRFVSFRDNPIFGRGKELEEEYGDDQGHMVQLMDGLWPIEEELGRKTWLHTVRDLGRGYEFESVY